MSITEYGKFCLVRVSKVRRVEVIGVGDLSFLLLLVAYL